MRGLSPGCAQDSPLWTLTCVLRRIFFILKNEDCLPHSSRARAREPRGHEREREPRGHDLPGAARSLRRAISLAATGSTCAQCAPARRRGGRACAPCRGCPAPPESAQIRRACDPLARTGAVCGLFRRGLGPNRVRRRLAEGQPVKLENKSVPCLHCHCQPGFVTGWPVCVATGTTGMFNTTSQPAARHYAKGEKVQRALLRRRAAPVARPGRAPWVSGRTYFIHY